MAAAVNERVGPAQGFQRAMVGVGHPMPKLSVRLRVGWRWPNGMDAVRSLLSPMYSAPFRCGMPRSPMESELIFAESESVRADWLVPIGRDTYVQSSDSTRSPSISFGLRAEWGRTSPN